MACAWSFNTYKINVSQPDTYLFQLQGDAQGSEGSDAVFMGKIVVQNSYTPTQFYDLEMLSTLEGSYLLNTTANDTAVYLIVAAVPETFTSVTQTYGYDIQITKGAILGVDENMNYKPKPELLQRFDILGRVIPESYKGIQIEIYDDGSVKKVFNE